MAKFKIEFYNVTVAEMAAEALTGCYGEGVEWTGRKEFVFTETPMEDEDDEYGYELPELEERLFSEGITESDYYMCSIVG